MNDDSATSEARTIRFLDERPPQFIQSELEREHMVLLRPDVEGSRLSYHAQSRINGATYRLHLRFEAALERVNLYCLRIEICWKQQPKASHDYHRKSAPVWLDSWLHRYPATTVDSTNGHSESRYRALVESAAGFEANLVDAEVIQQRILKSLRAGASFSTAHKEGGTRMFFRHDRYIRSDFGDNERTLSFTEDSAFLAHLRSFYDAQTSRGAHPAKVDDLTAWRLVLRLMDFPEASSAPSVAVRSRPGARAAHLAISAKRGKLAVLVAAIGAASAIAWGTFSNALTVKTVGTPMGTAVGSPDHVVMLIRTQKPYLPSLHRDASKDRFRIALLVQHRDSGVGNGRRLIPILDDLDASQSQHAAKMLGFDGRAFWLLARDIVGYDPARQQLIRVQDLRRANPGLESLWDVASYEVRTTLIACTRDRRTIVTVDPRTLAARTLDRLPPRRHPLPQMSADAMLAPAPARGADVLTPAYVRRDYGEPPLKLDDPAGWLVVYWRKTGALQRMLYVARIAADGGTLWEAQTGIDQLRQVLPDPATPALIGTRPRVPDKVPEPILVVIGARSGAVVQHSLWLPN